MEGRPSPSFCHQTDGRSLPRSSLDSLLGGSCDLREVPGGHVSEKGDLSLAQTPSQETVNIKEEEASFQTQRSSPFKAHALPSSSSPSSGVAVKRDVQRALSTFSASLSAFSLSSQDRRQVSLSSSPSYYSQESRHSSSTTVTDPITSSIPTPASPSPSKLSPYSSLSSLLSGEKKRRSSLHSPYFTTFSRLPPTGRHQGSRRRRSSGRSSSLYQSVNHTLTTEVCALYTHPSERQRAVCHTRKGNSEKSYERNAPTNSLPQSSEHSQASSRASDETNALSPSSQSLRTQVVFGNKGKQQPCRSSLGSELSSFSLPLSDVVGICTPQPSTKYETGGMRDDPEETRPSTPAPCLSASSSSSSSSAQVSFLPRYSTLSAHTRKRRHSSSLSHGLSPSPSVLLGHPRRFLFRNAQSQEVGFTPIKTSLGGDEGNEDTHTAKTAQGEREKNLPTYRQPSERKTPSREEGETLGFVFHRARTPPSITRMQDVENQQVGSDFNSVAMKTPSFSELETEVDIENMENRLNGQSPGPLVNQNRRRRLSRVLGDIMGTLASSAAGLLLRKKMREIDVGWCTDTPQKERQNEHTPETNNAAGAVSLKQKNCCPDEEERVLKKRIISCDEDSHRVRTASKHTLHSTQRENDNHQGVHTPEVSKSGPVRKDETATSQVSSTSVPLVNDQKEEQIRRSLIRDRQKIDGTTPGFSSQDGLREYRDSSFFSPSSSSSSRRPRQAHLLSTTPSTASRNGSQPDGNKQSASTHKNTPTSHGIQDSSETETDGRRREGARTTTPAPPTTPTTQEEGDAKHTSKEQEIVSTSSLDGGESTREDSACIQGRSRMAFSASVHHEALLMTSVEERHEGRPATGLSSWASGGATDEAPCTEERAKEPEDGGKEPSLGQEATRHEDEDTKTGRFPAGEDDWKENSFLHSVCSHASSSSSACPLSPESGVEERKSSACSAPLILPPPPPPRLLSRRRRSSGGGKRASSSSYLYAGWRDLGEAATARAWLVRSSSLSRHSQAESSYTPRSGVTHRPALRGKAGGREEDEGEECPTKTSFEGASARPGNQRDVCSEEENCKDGSGENAAGAREQEEETTQRMTARDRMGKDSTHGEEAPREEKEDMDRGRKETERRREEVEGEDDFLTAAYRWLGPPLSAEETKCMREREAQEEKRKREQEEELKRRRKEEEEEQERRRKEEQEERERKEEERRREEEERRKEEEEKKTRERKEEEEKKGANATTLLSRSLNVAPSFCSSSASSLAPEFRSSSVSQACLFFPSSAPSLSSLPSSSSSAAHPDQTRQPSSSSASSPLVSEAHTTKDLQQSSAQSNPHQAKPRALPRLRIRRTAQPGETDKEGTNDHAPTTTTTTTTGDFPQPQTSCPAQSTSATSKSMHADPHHQQSAPFSSPSPFSLQTSPPMSFSLSASSPFLTPNTAGDAKAEGMNVFAFQPGRTFGGRAGGGGAGGRRPGARRGRR